MIGLFQSVIFLSVLLSLGSTIALRLLLHNNISFGNASRLLGASAHLSGGLRLRRRRFAKLWSSSFCGLFFLVGGSLRCFNKFAVVRKFGLDRLLFGISLLLALANITDPVFVFFHLFDAKATHVSYVRATITADNVATILAYHAVFIPLTGHFRARDFFVFFAGTLFDAFF